jgi:amidase
VSQTYAIVDDPFVIRETRHGAAEGPLKGLRLAVKDLFDVEGLPTACGVLDWPKANQPATGTASAVQALLDAGATMVGKTITEQLAASLVGQNIDYGTPKNPITPDRIPGGSSSGSAVAVAGNSADLGLGTDTGGSVRIPALYNNLYGLRPTHGRVSAEGCMDLSAPLDTIGLMTRDARSLALGMAVLLDEAVAEPALPDAEILMASALFEPLEPRMRNLPALIAEHLGAFAACEVADAQAMFQAGVESFGVVQGIYAWAEHGAWIAAENPRLAPDIRSRFDLAATRKREQEAPARARAQAAYKPLTAVLDRGGFIILPTGPAAAQKFSEISDPTALENREITRKMLLGLTSISPLLGVPQIQIPVPNTDGVPRGVSVMGPKGSDRALLGLAQVWADRLSGSTQA